jgi:predicted nucleic-acid-binding Zn-ribbon protein
VRNMRRRNRQNRQQQATGRFANAVCKPCGHAEEMHLFSTKGLFGWSRVTVEVSTIRPDGRVHGACDNCGCNNFVERR